MKKKLFIPLLILAIISSLSISVPTFAETSDDATKNFWTIPELIELKAEYDRERDVVCSGDLECEENRRFELLEQGGVYNALDSFSNMILMITSINPSASTVRVLFHDEDPTIRIMGETEPAVLDEIFIAWFSREPVMFNNYYAKNGHYDMEMYFLFSGSASTRGRRWFTPNTEKELRISHADALLKSPHYIFFTMEGERTSVSGMHDYSNCIESPFFEEGMECRIVFDDAGGFDFRPFWPGADYPADWLRTNDEEGYGGVADTTIDGSSDAATIEDGNASATPLINAISDVTPSSPNTGSPTKPASSFKRSKELIWYPILIIFLSDIFIFWWFWPEERSH